MTLMYSDRQFIIVVGDDEVQSAERRPVEVSKGKGTPMLLIPTVVGGTGVALPLVAVGVASAAFALQQWRESRGRPKDTDLPYLLVTSSQAQRLNFPYDHPRKNVIYVADPGVGGNYYPIADFHRILFDAKVAEAVRLLSCLAATEFSVEYIKGFDRSASVNVSAFPPKGAGIDVGGTGKSTDNTKSEAKAAMKLFPTAPAHIPSDLRWFRSEPLWQEVARLRLESGLRTFNLDLSYTDDFGIDASLKAKFAEVGFGLGGTFTEYRETQWKISGTFAELPPKSSDPS